VLRLAQSGCLCTRAHALCTHAGECVQLSVLSRLYHMHPRTPTHTHRGVRLDMRTHTRTRTQVFGSACSIAYNRCDDLKLWERLARCLPSTHIYSVYRHGRDVVARCLEHGGPCRDSGPYRASGSPDASLQHVYTDVVKTWLRTASPSLAVCSLAASADCVSYISVFYLAASTDRVCRLRLVC
jgi:hypothetical protein